MAQAAVEAALGRTLAALYSVAIPAMIAVFAYRYRQLRPDNAGRRHESQEPLDGTAGTAGCGRARAAADRA